MFSIKEMGCDGYQMAIFIKVANPWDHITLGERANTNTPLKFKISSNFTEIP